MKFLPSNPKQQQPTREFRDAGLRTHGGRQGMYRGNHFID